MIRKCKRCGIEYFCLACHLISEHGHDSEEFDMDDHIMMSDFPEFNNKII